MKHTNEGKALTDIILETFKLNGFLIVAGDQLTQDLNLTSARWKVLGALSNSDNPMTVPEIGRMMGLTRQAVQRLTNEMKKDGLLTSRTNSKHKRSKLFLLTNEGKNAFTLLEKKQTSWINLIGNDFNSTELDITSSVLQKLIHKLEHP